MLVTIVLGCVTTRVFSAPVFEWTVRLARSPLTENAASEVVIWAA
jgi:hypothetical protein